MVIWFSKDKSGLSNMVGYSLLIVITVALTVLVYVWLRGYVEVEDIDQCPAGVEVIIKSYELYAGGVGGGATSFSYSDSSLVSWWKMDDVNVTHVFDNNSINDGVIVGGATQFDEGYLGEAFDFEGDGDYLNCGDDSSLEVTNYTISAWINASSWGEAGYGRIYNKVVSSDGVEFYINDDDNNLIVKHEGVADEYMSSSFNSITLNDWHHVVIAYDGSGSIYIDGVDRTFDSIAGAPSFVSSDALIGIREDGNREFDGLIDEVMVFDRKLLPEEIASLYSDMLLAHDGGPLESAVIGLKVVLKNKGRFTVDGYIIRVHDEEGAEFGFYVLDEEGAAIASGEEDEQTYYFEDYSFDGYTLTNVSLIEVQPFMLDGDVIRCKSSVLKSVAGYCGDGVVNVELGEECDDGNYVNGDDCDVGCLFPPVYSFKEDCFEDYAYGMTFVGSEAYCLGVDCFCSVKENDGTIILDTPDLPSLGEYNVIFKVGFDGHFNESYQVLCGSRVYDFSDLIYEDGVVSENYENILCDFDLGVNELSFDSTGDGSVHFHSVEIISDF